MKSDLAASAGESNFGPKQRQCYEISLQWQKTKPTKLWVSSERVQRTTQRITFNLVWAKDCGGNSRQTTEISCGLCSLQFLEQKLYLWLAFFFLKHDPLKRDKMIITVIKVNCGSGNVLMQPEKGKRSKEHVVAVPNDYRYFASLNANLKLSLHTAV